MKHHYGALSAVPKIFYKQNVQDNAKGADSVHIVLNNNDFSIWFGEAKFYPNLPFIPHKKAQNQPKAGIGYFLIANLQLVIISSARKGCL